MAGFIYEQASSPFRPQYGIISPSLYNEAFYQMNVEAPMIESVLNIVLFLFIIGLFEDNVFSTHD